MASPGAAGPVQPDRLLAGVLSGDHSALVELGQVYGVIVRRVARKHFHLSENDSQDLIHDLVVALMQDDYRLLRSYRGEASLTTWLGQIARRRCLDWVRRAATRQVISRCKAISRAFSPARIDEQLTVRQALSHLKPRDRVLVRYFFFEGRSCKETASALHLQENTVASCLFRVKSRLRDLLLGTGLNPQPLQGNASDMRLNIEEQNERD
jgi:RNA polymerase sigma-70 factor (ECF subfamily)